MERAVFLKKEGMRFFIKILCEVDRKNVLRKGGLDAINHHCARIMKCAAYCGRVDVGGKVIFLICI
jgi:hypothetical protein